VPKEQKEPDRETLLKQINADFIDGKLTIPDLVHAYVERQLSLSSSSALEKQVAKITAERDQLLRDVEAYKEANSQLASQSASSRHEAKTLRKEVGELRKLVQLGRALFNGDVDVDAVRTRGEEEKREEEREEGPQSEMEVEEIPVTKEIPVAPRVEKEKEKERSASPVVVEKPQKEREKEKKVVEPSRPKPA
jgi:hypothetical protein